MLLPEPGLSEIPVSKIAVFFGYLIDEFVSFRKPFLNGTLFHYDLAAVCYRIGFDIGNDGFVEPVGT